MKIKRILSVLIAVIMVLSVLAGCKGSLSSVKVASPVDEDGAFRYLLVRGADSSSVIQNCVREMRSAIKKNFDCDVTVAKDSAFDDDETFYEIIIGESSRAATKEAKQILVENRANSADDFIIKVSGRKIVIFALNDDITETAVNWFISTFCESEKTWSYLYDGYQFIYAPENEEQGNLINKVNNVDIGIYTVVLPRQVSYIVGRQTEYYSEYMLKFGYNIKVVEERDAEEIYEIIIGDTQREASKGVTVEGDNYIIKVVGNKIVIKGGTILATYRGAEEFVRLIKNAEASGTPINWTDGYTVNGKYDAKEEGTYTLNFNDEFESSVINANYWGDQRYTKKITAASALGGTVYSTNWRGDCDLEAGKGNKLIYTSDGVVHIGTMRANDKDFVIADMSTNQTMAFRYGYIETRMKQAPSPAYSGIWLNGSANTETAIIKRFGGIMNHSAFTEIDIIENFSSEDSYHVNIHHWYNLFKADGISTSGNGHNSIDGDARYNGKSLNNKKFVYDTNKNGDNLTDDFHIYSCYWDNDTIDFAFDGKRIMSYKLNENDMPSVNCGMLYAQIESGMGSASYGKTYNRDEHEKSYESQFDYVKIYQSNALNSQMVYAWPQYEEKGTLKYVYPQHDVNGKY